MDLFLKVEKSKLEIKHCFLVLKNFTLDYSMKFLLFSFELQTYFNVTLAPSSLPKGVTFGK